MEVARRLLERGEEVALLGFLDSYPPNMYWPLRCWIYKIIRRGTHHVRALAKVSIKEALVGLVHLWRALLDHLRERRGEMPKKWVDPQGENSAATRSVNKSVGKWNSCKPRYYDGTIIFFKAVHPTDTLLFPSLKDTLLIWQKFARSIEMHVIRGGHVDVLVKHPEALAKCISGCINRAKSE